MASKEIKKDRNSIILSCLLVMRGWEREGEREREGDLISFWENPPYFTQLL